MKLFNDSWDFLFKMAFIGMASLLLVVIWSGYKIYQYNFQDTIVESKTKPIINYKLTTDGIKVDTIYVYTFTKE